MWPNGAFDIVLDRMFLLRRSSSAVYTTNCSETSRQFRIWMDVNRNKSYRKIEVLVRKEPSQSRDIVWGSRIQVHCCSSWYCVLYVDGFLHSTSGPPSSNTVATSQSIPSWVPGVRMNYNAILCLCLLSLQHTWVLSVTSSRFYLSFQCMSYWNPCRVPHIPLPSSPMGWASWLVQGLSAEL